MGTLAPGRLLKVGYPPGFPEVSQPGTLQRPPDPVLTRTESSWRERIPLVLGAKTDGHHLSHFPSLAPIFPLYKMGITAGH